jgi:hypothetical protein
MAPALQIQHRQKSRSFLKKTTKKRLLLEGFIRANARGSKSFLRAFFQKSAAFSCLKS